MQDHHWTDILINTSQPFAGQSNKLPVVTQDGCHETNILLIIQRYPTF